MDINTYTFTSLGLEPDFRRLPHEDVTHMISEGLGRGLIASHYAVTDREGSAMDVLTLSDAIGVRSVFEYPGE